MSNPIDGLSVRLTQGQPKTIRSLQVDRDFHFPVDGKVGSDIFQSYSSADALQSLSDPRVEEFYQAFRQVAPQCHSKVNVWPSKEEERRAWGEKFNLDELAQNILGPGWGNAHYCTGNYGADHLKVFRADQLGGMQSLRVSIPDTDTEHDGGKELSLISGANIEGVRVEHSLSKQADYHSGVMSPVREKVQFYPKDWTTPKFAEV